MKRVLLVLALVMLTAANVSAGAMVSGVGAITELVGNSPAPGNNGVTFLANTGTILDGLYGTEKGAYLVDDFPGALTWADNLKIQATMVVNNEGDVNSADNIAILGYFADSNHGDGDYQGDVNGSHLRGDAMFGVDVFGPGGGGDRIFLSIGGNQINTGLTWSQNGGGRDIPFDVDLTASEAGGSLTVTGTITINGGVNNINLSSGVNSNQNLEAFGVAQGYIGQVGTFRNYGMDVSDLSYISTVPEPTTIGLALVGLSAMALRRRSR